MNRRGWALGASLAALVAVVGLAGLSRTWFEVRADAVIDAPPSAVWAVIVDFPRYHEWNTQLAWLGGDAGPGAVLSLRLSVAGADPYTFSPTVSHWEPDRRFAWLARTGPPGVFDGEHFFELEALADGKTRLVHRERYAGVLSPILRRLPMMAGAQAGFEQMNAELEARVASLSARP